MPWIIFQWISAASNKQFLKSVRVGRRRYIQTIAVMLAAAGSLPAMGQGGDWIPFAENESRPSFEVTVNGETGVAILQPSLAVNGVSSDFAERAGIEEGGGLLSMNGVYGEQQAPEVKPFKLALAGAEMKAQDFVILPDDSAATDVVFGRQLFQGAILQLDYPNRRLRILPPDGVQFDANAKFKLSQNNRPLVEMLIGGKETRLLLDTSSTGMCLLTNSVVRKRGWNKHQVENRKLKNLAIPIDAQMQAIVLEEAVIGPYVIENFLAAYSPEGDHLIDARKKVYGSPREMNVFDADGILGYEVLQNFVVTLDVSKQKVHFYMP